MATATDLEYLVMELKKGDVPRYRLARMFDAIADEVDDLTAEKTAVSLAGVAAASAAADDLAATLAEYDDEIAAAETLVGTLDFAPIATALLSTTSTADIIEDVETLLGKTVDVDEDEVHGRRTGQKKMPKEK